MHGSMTNLEGGGNEERIRDGNLSEKTTAVELARHT